MGQKTVTKSCLCEALKKKCRLTHVEANSIVTTIFAEITEVLKTDQKLKIPLFGVFFSRYKKERIGRNPKTKVEAKISARRVPVFRLSRLMKSRVNDSLSEE